MTSVSVSLTASASDSGGHTPGGRPRRDRKVPLKLQDPLMVSPAAAGSPSKRQQATAAGKKKGGVKFMVKVGGTQLFY